MMNLDLHMGYINEGVCGYCTIYETGVKGRWRQCACVTCAASCGILDSCLNCMSVCVCLESYCESVKVCIYQTKKNMHESEWQRESAATLFVLLNDAWKTSRNIIDFLFLLDCLKKKPDRTTSHQVLQHCQSKNITYIISYLCNVLCWYMCETSGIYIYIYKTQYRKLDDDANKSS